MPRASSPIDGINRDTYAEALRAHGHRNVITIDGEDDLAAAVAPYLKAGRRGDRDWARARSRAGCIISRKSWRRS